DRTPCGPRETGPRRKTCSSLACSSLHPLKAWSLRQTRRGSVPIDQEIFDRIYLAILERRLRPGLPLREAELAEMFGVGRTKARRAHDVAQLINLTGEFHLLLAAQLGNPLIDRLLKGLEALTCLSILSYSRRDTCACLPHEHTGILEALAKRDAADASRLMVL